MTKPEDMPLAVRSASSTPETSAESVTEDSRKNAYIKLNVNYMDGQTEINAKMRGEMVECMTSQLATHSQETLLVAVNTMDRYLSTTVVSKDTFSLVAIACIGIALEHVEDILVPPGELVKLIESPHTELEMDFTKNLILKSLNYVLETPCHFQMLKQIRKDDIDDLAFLLVDLSLVHYSMLKYEASVVTQAALYLALKLRKSQEEFGSFVGDLDIIHDCALQLLGYYFQSSQSFSKYNYKSF